MNKFIEDALKPFLDYILKLIENEQYKKIYLGIVIIVLLIVFFIYILSKIIANKKIKSELRKNDEERKEKQIKNFENLVRSKDKYVSDLKNAQNIAKQIISSMKAPKSEENTQKVRQLILSCRSIVFNDLLKSLDEYFEVYAIIYESINYRFVELFSLEYIPLMNQINQILGIINHDKVLEKTKLPKYFVDKYVFEKKYNFMKNHLPKYRIFKKLSNKNMKKKILDKFTK